MTFGFTLIKEFLHTKHTVVWPPKYWDVSDEKERGEAAAWLQNLVEELEEYRGAQQRVTAGTALNNLALRTTNYQDFTQRYVVGGNRNAPIESPSPNGASSTGHSTGQEHPGYPETSSASEHSAGDEGDHTSDPSSGEGDEPGEEWYEWPGWRPEDKLDKEG